MVKLPRLVNTLHGGKTGKNPMIRPSWRGGMDNIVPQLNRNIQLNRNASLNVEYLSPLLMFLSSDFMYT